MDARWNFWVFPIPQSSILNFFFFVLQCPRERWLFPGLWSGVVDMLTNVNNYQLLSVARYQDHTFLGIFGRWWYVPLTKEQWNTHVPRLAFS